MNKIPFSLYRASSSVRAGGILGGMTIPKVDICDQGGPHWGLYRKLGATKELPYFEHTHDNVTSNVYAMWDTPHLLKSFRNKLINYDIKAGDVVFSWWPRRFKHDLQQGDPTELRLIPKLTCWHINPNKYKKRRGWSLLELLPPPMVGSSGENRG